MHPTADESGRLFFQFYRSPSTINVLDIGSQDLNGTLRPHADGLKYTDLDIAPGPGADAVSPPGASFPFDDEAFDLVVSTSCFEHDPCFWATFLEAIRVLRPGGFFYINAPSNGPYHGYPFDNWRFYPDAGRALAGWGKRNGHSLRLVESGTLRQRDDLWNDFVAVFQKAPFSDPARYLVDAFPEAMNVRRSEDGEIERLTVLTQDQSMRADADARADLVGEQARLIGQLKGELEAIRNSHSWKLTAPLRKARERFSSVRAFMPANNPAIEVKSNSSIVSEPRVSMQKDSPAKLGSELIEISKRYYDHQDPNAKLDHYFVEYERLLRPLRDYPVKILEIGVFDGHSLLTWRDYLPQATIVGLDLKEAPAKIRGRDRIHFIQGSQADPAALDAAVAAAGGPFDLIIDDASHVGHLTKSSFVYLFPKHLKPGSSYIIEDIGTAFLTGQYPEALPYVEPSLDETGQYYFPSHQAGIVGFVKQLADHVQKEIVTGKPNSLPIYRVSVLSNMAIIEKRA